MDKVKKLRLALLAIGTILSLFSLVRDKVMVTTVPTTKPIVAEAYHVPQEILPPPLLNSPLSTNLPLSKPTQQSTPDSFVPSSPEAQEGQPLSNSGAPKDVVAPPAATTAQQQAVLPATAVYGLASVYVPPDSTTGSSDGSGGSGSGGSGSGGTGGTVQPNSTSSVYITGITPNSGVAGTSVIIQGAGFDVISSNNKVKFGSANAGSVTYVSKNQLKVTVPPGLSAGFAQIAVTVNSVNSNTSLFSVLKSAGGNIFSDNTQNVLPAGLNLTDSSIIRLADVDKDNDLDMFIVDTSAGSAYLLINNGQGVFTNETSSRLPMVVNASFITDVAFQDVNQDGYPDIVLTYSSGQSVRLLLNDGTGKFNDVTATNLPSLSGTAVSLDVGDANGDGMPDIIIANNDSQDILLINDGTGKFAKDTNFNLPAVIDGSSDIRFCDINSDGNLDIITTNNEVVGASSLRNRVYVNDGQGHFTDNTESLMPSNNDYSEVFDCGDIDNNGNTDIIVANYNQNAVLVNNGTGSFSDETAARMPTNDFASKDAKLGDMNGDGYLDIVMLGETRMSLLVNDGQGHFKENSIKLPDYKSTPALVGGKNVQVADINGDGLLDIIVGGTSPHILVNTTSNKPPVLDHIGPKTVGIGNNLTFNVNATDPNGDLLTYLAQNLPTGPNGATFQSKVFNWTPAASDIGTHDNVVFIARESNTADALEASESITITVTGSGLPIIDSYIPQNLNLTLGLGEIELFGITAHDPDNAPLTFKWFLNNVEIPAQSGASSSLLFIVPRIGDNVIECRVGNTVGSVSALWHVTVGTAINQPPQITGYNPNQPTVNIDLTAGGGYSFSITATDPEGDSLSYQWKFDTTVLSSTGATLSSSAFVGSAGVGDHTLQVSVSDGHNTAVTHSWTIHVTQGAINQPPQITGYSPTQPIVNIDLTAGGGYSFSITATDPEGDSLSYQWKFDTTVLSSSGATLSSSAFVGSASVGDHTLQVSVSDGHNTPVTHSWTIHITQGTVINNPPVINSQTPASSSVNITTGNPQTFTVNASDADGDTITYSWTVNGVAAGTNSSSFTYTPIVDGQYPVVVTVDDGKTPAAQQNKATWNLVATSQMPVNNPPVINSQAPASSTVNITTGNSQTFTVNASDADGDTITYSWTVNGTAAGTNSSSFTYTPIVDGQYPVVVTVDDGKTPAAQQNKATWTLVATSQVPVNHAPVINSHTPANTTITLNVGDSQNFSITASDQDSGDTLIYSWAVNGTSVGTNSDSYTYNPTASGQFTVRVTVTDGKVITPPEQVWTVTVNTQDIQQVLNDIIQHSFGYFWHETDNPATGFVRDRLPIDVANRNSTYDSHYNMASMGATGFGLAAMCVAAEKYGDGSDPDWQVTKDKLRARTELIMNKLLEIQGNQDPGDAGTWATWGRDGFFYHFVNIETGQRWVDSSCKSEVSTIDTAILVAGVLTAGEYFGGDLKDKALQIYKNVNWKAFLDNNTTASNEHIVANPYYNQIYHAWSPDQPGSNKFFGHWDYTSECFLLYMLAVATPDATHAIPPEAFYTIRKELGNYGANGNAMVKSWFGSLFTYQYTQAFFNFKDASGQPLYDKQGVDWWQNSVEATKANKQYCNDNLANYAEQEDLWGLTSGYTNGFTYDIYGAPPAGVEIPSADAHGADGTIHPSAAGGSIAMLPDECGRAITKMKELYDIYGYQIWGDYGFVNSFKMGSSLSDTPSPISSFYCAVDVGVSLVMAENHNSGLIWNKFSGFELAPGKTLKDVISEKIGFSTNKTCVVTVDDPNPESNFHMGQIDAANPNYIIQFNLGAINDNPYLLAIHAFMAEDIGNHTVNATIKVNDATPLSISFDYNTVANPSSLMKYIQIDPSDLKVGANTITLQWQDATDNAKWLAWKNIEVSSPLVNNTWVIARNDTADPPILFGNEYRVDDTYYAGAPVNTFEQALNKDVETFTDILFFNESTDYAALTLRILETQNQLKNNLKVFVNGSQTPVFDGQVSEGNNLTTPGFYLEKGWNRITLYHPGVTAPAPSEWIRWDSVTLAQAESPVPNAPTGLAGASFGSDKINLRWNSVMGTNIRYNLYRSQTSGGPYVKVNSSEISSTQYQDSGLSDNTTYYYTVKAFKEADPSSESAYSGEDFVKTGSYGVDYGDGKDPNAFGGNSSANFTYLLGSRYDFTLGQIRKIILNPNDTGWIDLNGVDLSQATSLSLWIKGTGGEKITLGLRDKAAHQSEFSITVASGWQNLIVKLSDFNGVSLTSLDRIYLTSTSTSSIALYLDSIKFSRDTITGYSLDTVTKNISDNTRTTGMAFSGVPGPEYAPAGQYVEVKYGVNANNWKIWIYTKNDNGDPAYLNGLFNGLMRSDGHTRIPLIWRVYPTTQPGGVPCSTSSDVITGGNMTWNYIKDKNDSDWTTANLPGQEYSVICYGSSTWAHLASVPPGSGTRDPVNSTFYVYIGGEFKAVSAGDYSAIIYFDLTHE